jgi:hypothetical protein
MSTVEQRLRAALTAKSDAVSLVDYQVEVPEPCALLVLPDPHHHARLRWHAVVATAVAAVVLIAVGVTVLAGRAGNTHHLAAAGRSDVPWSQVGPDWTLAVAIDPVTDPDLVLVSPAGVRYLICQLPAPFVELQPWAAGTGKALLTDLETLTGSGLAHDIEDVLVVDLHTGAQTRTNIPSKYSTVQFASPGLDSLLVTYPTSMQLVSADTGRTLARYPIEGGVLGSTPSPDGSQVVAGGLAGLVVFDRVSGRRTHTLATPAGFGPCQVLRWMPAGNEILAECFTRRQNLNDQDFTFAADGRQAPQPDGVPAGWREIRLAAGNVAYQPAAHNTPGPLDVVFGRVDLTGRLTHLSVPAALEQGRWQLAGATTNLLLFDQRTGPLGYEDILRLAAWNPLTGAFTILLSTAGPPVALDYTSWQQYQPPLLQLG